MKCVEYNQISKLLVNGDYKLCGGYMHVACSDGLSSINNTIYEKRFYRELIFIHKCIIIYKRIYNTLVAIFSSILYLDIIFLIVYIFIII